MKCTKDILVVGPSWVGDMVMAQSLLKVCKQRYPEAAIDVLAPSWSEPVLARMPEVRQAVILDVAHGEWAFQKRWQLGISLQGRYRRAIVLPRSFKSSLVPFAANIRFRTGFLGEMRYFLINDPRLLNKRVLDQTVKRYVALGLSAEEALEPFNIPYPQLMVDQQQQQTSIQRLNLPTDKPVIALFPGAEYGPAKQWPLTHYQSLSVNLQKQGYNVWVFGSHKDRQVGAQVVEGNGGYNLCGETSLTEAIDLIAYCHAAVTNDSGLMHVAAAVACPLVAIYGSSSPALTPPLTEEAEVIHLDLPCSPCFKRQCPLKHVDCLQQVTVDQVIRALGRLTKSA